MGGGAKRQQNTERGERRGNQTAQRRTTPLGVEESTERHEAPDLRRDGGLRGVLCGFHLVLLRRGREVANRSELVTSCGLLPVAGENAETPRDLRAQRRELPRIRLATLVTPAGIHRETEALQTPQKL